MTPDPARSPSISITAWLLLLGLAAVAAQLAYYYPQLPDTVASHFGANGKPDDWSSKPTYTVIILTIATLLALTFLGIGPFLRRLPDRMINFPNRDHWLAPSRRDESLAALVRLIHWVGLATLALLIAMNQLVFEANLHPPAMLGAASWLLIIAYLVLVLLWSVCLFLRFRVGRAEPHPR